jgi:uncharacterized membrane protein
MLHIATALPALITNFLAAGRDARPMSLEAIGMLPKFLHDDRAAVSVLAALSLTAVIGASTLAVEFGHALLQRSDNQRVADLAAYGGALVYNSVYNSTGSTTRATADGKNAASNIAALNGLTSGNATVTTAIVPSPTGNGNQAMQVSVTTNLPMYLARVLTSSATLPVAATASAEIKPGAPSAVALVQ